MVGALAVAAQRALGLASVLADQRGGAFRPQASNRFQPLQSLVPQVGTRWQGRGTAFVSRPCRLECPRRACWEAGDQEAWVILTDLPPESSQACRYGLCAWLEPGCKITKRGGWQWQRTRLTDPERAARLWLAVATLWLLGVGGAADESLAPSTLPLKDAPGGVRRGQRRLLGRSVHCRGPPLPRTRRSSPRRRP